GAFRLDVVVRRRRLGLGWVRREGAGDEGGTVVQDRGRAVDTANKRALAAADQAHAQLAVQRGIDRHSTHSFHPGVNRQLGNLGTLSPQTTAPAGKREEAMGRLPVNADPNEPASRTDDARYAQ